jgi:glycine betaine catabolism B
MLYFLIVILIIGAVYTIVGILPFSFQALFVSISSLLIFCWVFNKIFSRMFRAPTNLESVYITALILSCLIAPSITLNGFIFVVAASFIAMASKYLIAYHKKHLFNPAAFAMVVTALTINQAASWWIGTTAMMPFLWIGGLLVVKKLRRFELVLSFFVLTIATAVLTSLFNSVSPFDNILHLFVDSQLPFFAFVMLTEPLTAPPTKKLQALYGGLVGFLSSAPINIGTIYMSPELALVMGNLFSFVISPKYKLLLSLKEKNKLSEDTYEFSFKKDHQVFYQPGQYMEWTLGHKSPDSRGNRRYFTIASSPTEEDLKLGIKFNKNSSSFKKKMLSLDPKEKITAGQLMGDFTLPQDQNQKLVFIAGGIGITPFRSMIKFLLDKEEKRDIVIFYSNKTKNDIVYKNLLDQAEKKLEIKVIYTLTDKDNVPSNWSGKVGYLDYQVIKNEVPDYKNRTFYLSGPQSLVDSFKKTLKNMGIHRSRIKTDYFPGFA